MACRGSRLATDGLNASAAAAEYLRRQRARSSLAEYSLAIDIPGVPVHDFLDLEEPLKYDGAGRIIGGGRLKDATERETVHFKPIESRVALHHLLMMQAIQRCMETPRGRLIVMAPPGTAKSTYASVVGTSWALGRWPGTQIIMTSYASAIIAKQSRRVRQICRDPQYSSIWAERPTLADDQRAIDDWSLTNESSMMCGGILAGITGNRADGFIIDDPLSNREQADSATIREKIYDEYTDTVLTRAKPKMWVIIIMTRWHQDDLVGSILPEQYEGESGIIACRDGQNWEVLCLQAECERDDDPLGRKRGDFIWPEWFPREHWSSWRDNPRARRTWNALFQQRPAPQTGVHFSREMFKRYDERLARVD
ncbi:MAG: terminase family protein [Patescibacteria group bacterium]|nr:terminase family protein [Patescibacteria group bacterium]